MAQLTFHGAARQVTGSMHLLEANGKLIALDCGLFQGRRADSRALNRRHPCDPASLHAVVVSHAHIDHTGRLPLLVRDGFSGVIHTTPATRDLSAILLVDSAHIQAEDAKFLNKKRHPEHEPEVEPLYEEADAVQAVRQMQSSPYQRWFKVAHGVHARYFDAGHMLGSAGIEVEITEGEGRKQVLVFSGDVGRWSVPILRDPAPLPECDYLICESTYGGRVTDAVADLPARLAEVVRRTIARDGRVIIPAFSVGRTQTILYTLRQLFVSGELQRVPVYVDSPMAVNATEIFRLHPECYDRGARDFAARDGGLLHDPAFRFVQDVEESKRITRRRSACVVISASGMCEAGRILHHLKHSVRHERNTILIVGFQAAHTLGRRIVEREEFVKIYGERIKLQAEIAVLNGFSSHADAHELRRHTDPLIGRCRRVFLVHGEPDQAGALQETMLRAGHTAVDVPEMGAAFALD
ncbi:MAG: MBL fold metallo-hydrolase [Planctomycetes bacterium]|nr:MBL fold metallo-hydrolase [Planctomycetota bacterium]